MVGILAHRQMLAFAHHVADIAEHEEIAGHRARKARDIVGIAGDEARGKALGKMRRRGRVRDGIADALRQLFADGDIPVARKFDEAAGKIGIAGCQRRLDIFRNQRRTIPQGRIEPLIGQFGRIVLRRQDRKSVACVWQNQRKRRRAHRHTSQRQTDPRPSHVEKPNVFVYPNMGCRL